MDGYWELNPGYLQEQINYEDSLLNFKHRRSNKTVTQYSSQHSSKYFSKVGHIRGHKASLNK